MIGATTSVGGVRPGRLGFVALGAPDLEAMAEHYSNALMLTVVDRSDKAVYLSTGSEPWCIVLESGGRGLQRTGLQINVSLDDAHEYLLEHDVRSEWRTDPEPGIERALVVVGPDGVPLHLFEGRASQPTAPVNPLGLRKLGHMAVFVPDIEDAARFFKDTLGFRWGDSIAAGGRVFVMFLRVGPDHHTFNIQENADESGLHHIAFEAQDMEALKRVCDRFAQCGVVVDWGVGRHGPGHNVFTYHRDPDGNVVEVSCELDVMYDEEGGYYEPRPWHEDRPQRPKIWEATPEIGNLWGPGPADPEWLGIPSWANQFGSEMSRR
jgi:catechol 2,3-dioxygenase-like lactoylglutathione lyase family enzyme